MSGAQTVSMSLTGELGGAGLMDGSSAANAGTSALGIKRRTGTSTSGLYWVKPVNGTAEQVWCDMETSGGGWMLVARTHPSAAPTSGTWGWRGPAIGGATTYTNCYQLNLFNMYANGLRFSSFIFGNQLTNDSNNWGPFIYQVGVVLDTFMTSDTQQVGQTYGTIKADTNVFGSTTYPSMQQAIGFPVTGTANNIYYLRDCCGFSTYGVLPNGMQTTYLNAVDGYEFISGPWISTALSGNTYVQGGSSSPSNIGGAKQCMIMVR